MNSQNNFYLSTLTHYPEEKKKIVLNLKTSLLGWGERGGRVVSILSFPSFPSQYFYQAYPYSMRKLEAQGKTGQ